MVGALLWRGMLVGILAGVLCFAFLKIAGEPSVERAIAFEAQLEAEAPSKPHDHSPAAVPSPAARVEPEPVSRSTQAGIGLFTGVVVLGAALGGFFALAFALAHGRIGDLGPRALSLLLAALGFVAVALAPALKYPASPPAVGEAATIGGRTALYFSFIAISLAMIIAAGMLRSRLQPRMGTWNAALIATAAYVAIMFAVGFALPAVDEVPKEFPAVVLWQFRVAALGAQLILWTTLGLGFGALIERGAAGRARHRAWMV